MFSYVVFLVYLWKWELT